MNCRICRKPNDFFVELCPMCRLLLASARKPSKTLNESFRALFDYEEPLRTMILRAKVKNDFIALRFLRDLVLKEASVVELVQWSDAIMPAPSSLWGRLRGRFDIAGYVAAELGSEFGTCVMAPPRRLSFRLKKRAMLAGSVKADSVEILHFVQEAEKSFPFPERPFSLPERSEGSRQKAPKRLLLIDDVATTGFTVSQLSKELNDFEIKILTIAAAKTLQN